MSLNKGQFILKKERKTPGRDAHSELIEAALRVISAVFGHHGRFCRVLRNAIDTVVVTKVVTIFVWPRFELENWRNRRVAVPQSGHSARRGADSSKTGLSSLWLRTPGPFVRLCRGAAIRRTGQHARIASPRGRDHRRRSSNNGYTATLRSAYKSVHKHVRRAVSYSEKPVTNSTTMNLSTAAFDNTYICSVTFLVTCLPFSYSHQQICSAAMALLSTTALSLAAPKSVHKSVHKRGRSHGR